MYCQSCGIAIAQSMRYCNRCGALVLTSQESADLKKSEKRLDNYLDGLFWITVFGVALTAGGMVVLKKLEFSGGFIAAFMIISATAFLINFALNLWIILRLARNPRAGEAGSQFSNPQTNELEQPVVPPLLQSAPSVTENTTRSFEPVFQKRHPG